MNYLNYQNIDWNAIFNRPVCQLDENCIFLYETVAELDCYAKEGSYLIPANCVEATPPQPKENHAAKWQPETQTWKYLPDYRGKIVYDTTTGTEIVMSELGELPENVTVNPKPSGHHVWNGRGWEIPVEIAEQLTQQQFQTAKNAKLVALNTAAQNYINQATGMDKLPQFEKDTWAIQGQEAKAWAADNHALTPGLDGIASARGVPAQILKQKALEKTLAFEALTATVVGTRQAIETRINKAKDIDELEAIEFAFGVE